jgi:putative oxidoreductase
MATSTTNGSPSWLPKLLSIVRIAIGFLFIQHGLEKIWGVAGGRPDFDFSKIHAYAGPIETIGGALLIAGLFTRSTAFILCGEMAVAYFHSWFSLSARGFLPIINGGEEATLNCFLFLWLMTAGAGAWSLDALIEKRRKKVDADFGAADASIAPGRSAATSG